MAEKRVLVTGATGFIGSELLRVLVEEGSQVTAVVRRRDQLARFGSPIRTLLWDDDWALGQQDAVVHLSGERAVGVRWTEVAKQRILASRVETTAQVVARLERAAPRPRALISASAVGYYGDRPGDQPVDESGAAGSDFLATVCARWEAAARAAEALGVRVVLARLGIVLDRGGGALAEMVRPFRLFAGGPIGSGEQVVSWIHRADAARVLLRCIHDQTLSGPVNVVAPGSVTQARFAREIGETLGRPSWLRVPGAALRARFGEGAEPLLTGQRVVPAKLTAAGYVWHHPELRGALRAALS